MKYLFVILAFFISTTKADEHRSHGAHVHGHAKMTLVVSGNQMEIELDSPAMNFLNFEHQARADKDRKKLTDTVAFLKKAPNWVGVDKYARCHVNKIEINSDLIEEDNHEHQHEGDHEHQHEGHADFEIALNYSCANVEKLHAVNFSRLFNNFKGLHSIDVEWLTDQQQSASELNGNNPEVNLK